MNHLGDTNKMVDTPRMDAVWKTTHTMYELAGEMKRIERELNAANERIKQLEDRIHRAAIAFFRDGSDASVASGMLAILEEERNKP